jgi:hypothetical protein
MEWFYFITIAIAIILLICMLTFIGMRMAGNKKGSNTDDAFPPIKNTCPDLWASEIDDGKVWCKVPAADAANVGNLRGSITTLEAIPGYADRDGVASANFQDSDIGDCAKKTWASTNNITWDGITNYNQCDD